MHAKGNVVFATSIEKRLKRIEKRRDSLRTKLKQNWDEHKNKERIKYPGEDEDYYLAKPKKKVDLKFLDWADQETNEKLGRMLFEP